MWGWDAHISCDQLLINRPKLKVWVIRGQSVTMNIVSDLTLSRTGEGEGVGSWGQPE